VTVLNDGRSGRRQPTGCTHSSTERATSWLAVDGSVRVCRVRLRPRLDCARFMRQRRVCVTVNNVNNNSNGQHLTTLRIFANTKVTLRLRVNVGQLSRDRAARGRSWKLLACAPASDSVASARWRSTARALMPASTLPRSLFLAWLPAAVLQPPTRRAHSRAQTSIIAAGRASHDIPGDGKCCFRSMVWANGHLTLPEAADKFIGTRVSTLKQHMYELLHDQRKPAPNIKLDTDSPLAHRFDFRVTCDDALVMHWWTY
jgi:hypothetical protein